MSGKSFNLLLSIKKDRDYLYPFILIFYILCDRSLHLLYKKYKFNCWDYNKLGVPDCEADYQL
jgi:hypothetical protein